MLFQNVKWYFAEYALRRAPQKFINFVKKRCSAIFVVAIFFMTRPYYEIKFQEKSVFVILKNVYKPRDARITAFKRR